MGLAKQRIEDSMGQSMRNNRALRNKRTSHKEIAEDYKVSINTDEIVNKEMAPEDFVKFKEELLEKRKGKERRKYMFIGALCLAGLITILAIKYA
ncbi:MAG: hypothetical protein HRT71_07105 [Flavobacteriales bacterium]|nr:hypothetical protein [Flavobacteriales bacterium]